MIRQRVARRIAWIASLVLLGGLVLPTMASAKTPEEIDASVNAALANFEGQVRGANTMLQDAQGVLVFPGVVQAGIGIGGEFGEGALRVHGQDAGYFSLGAASVGFQFGAQVKDVIIVFLQRQALENFRATHGFTVGVDGSIVLVNLGAEASINTTTLNQPVIGFIVGQKGLMYNLTLQGSKISRIYPH
jgi:lipid-binding SYLF domain-containing protein